MCACAAEAFKKAGYPLSLCDVQYRDLGERGFQSVVDRMQVSARVVLFNKPTKGVS